MNKSIVNLVEKSPSLFLMSIKELLELECTPNDLRIIRLALLNISVVDGTPVCFKTNLVSEKLVKVIKGYDEFYRTETIIFMLIGLTVLHKIKFDKFNVELAQIYSKYSNTRSKPNKVLELVKVLAPADLFLDFSRDIPLSKPQKHLLDFIQKHIVFRVSTTEMDYIAKLPEIVNLLSTRISKLTKVIPVEDVISTQDKAKINAH